MNFPINSSSPNFIPRSRTWVGKFIYRDLGLFFITLRGIFSRRVFFFKPGAMGMGIYRGISFAGLILFSLLFLSGCSREDSDEYRQGIDSRIAVRNLNGNPDDIFTYDSTYYWSQTWWYWCKGVEYSFTKSERIEEKEEGSWFWDKRKKKIHYSDIIIESSYFYSPICS